MEICLICGLSNDTDTDACVTFNVAFAWCYEPMTIGYRFHLPIVTRLTNAASSIFCTTTAARRRSQIIGLVRL